jgi:hypothetical protein
MVWVTENRAGFTIQSVVEQIVSAGELTRWEHMQLTSTILADCKLTDEDRRYINRILDYVQIGRLKLVD